MKISPKKLSTKIENILVSFCISERLHYPSVKETFLKQDEITRAQHLAMMEGILAERKHQKEDKPHA